jgi:hypothetical protein
MNVTDIEQNGTPQQLLDGLNAYIHAADAMLDEKNMVDLAGLDAVVDILCARILALSPGEMKADEQKNYIDQLNALHERLGVLQQKMVATQEEIKAELARSNARQKASRAYMKENK